MTACHFVKVSNESPEKGLPWNKTRVGDREEPSQAIRKIHDDILLTILISFCLDSNKKQFFHPLK